MRSTSNGHFSILDGVNSPFTGKYQKLNGFQFVENLHQIFMLVWYLTVKFKTMKKLPQYLTNEQLNQLVQFMPTVMLKDALKVMYFFALRISELCDLEPGDVDLQRQVVTIRGKFSKVRQLPIKADVYEILERACRRPGKCFNVSVRTYRNYIYMAASRADVGHVHPHMVRHSRATHLLNAGVNLADIKAVMRHESFSSTLVYTHVAIDRLRSVM